MRWSRFKELAPEPMFELVRDKVFPFMKALGGNGDAKEGSTYTHHMKDAIFMMPTAVVLSWPDSSTAVSWLLSASKKSSAG